MEIKLIPVTTKADPQIFTGAAAVVFDVLRASSTIVTALAAGYQRVYPVTSKKTALALARQHGCWAAGERGGVKIDGFAHGNSPPEFWPGPPKAPPGGTMGLVLTTSNGTAAIQRAAGADAVLIGSLLNARAAALAALHSGKKIILACAGNKGGFSLEDFLGAGFVLREIIKAVGTPPPLDDFAQTAHILARRYGENPLCGLRASSHGQKLAQMGHDKDLLWCAQLNRFQLTPVLQHGYLAPQNPIGQHSRQLPSTSINSSPCP